MITRDEILRRARAVPQRSDSYSQSRLDNDGPNAGYRPDCSGFVSYCWNCPKSGPGTWGGYSTASFVTVQYAPGQPGIMYPIPRSELRPGDAIGHCTPTSGGNGGHIALWLGKSGNQEHILDHGGGMGPLDHTVTWGVGSGWNSASKIRAFRFRGVESPSGGVPPMTPATIPDGAPYPLASGHYYGDIKGPNASHGGFYPDEQPNIAAIQLKLIALGYVPGITPGSAAAVDWADGVYEGPTIEAVKRFQAVTAGLNVTGTVGPKTWAALFPAAPQPPAPDPTAPLPPAGVDMNALVAILMPLLVPKIEAAVTETIGKLKITLG